MGNKFSSLLDFLATFFGTVAGVAQLLVVTNRISRDDGLLISGLATIALGVVANKGRISYRPPFIAPNFLQFNSSNYDSPPYNDPYYEPGSQQAPGEATEVAQELLDQSTYSQYDSKKPTQYKPKYRETGETARFKIDGRRLKTKCDVHKPESNL